MKNQRPKNLDLLTISFPVPAITSILHRISGLALFLLIPLVLWAFSLSLASQADFDRLHDWLTEPFAKIIALGFLAGFIFHFVAGIRHLLMDVHIGEELKSGRWTAILTIIISIILTILAGIWLW